MSKWSVEGSFPFISLSDADEVVSIAEVQFGEDLHMTERLKEGFNQREGILVLMVMFSQW